MKRIILAALVWVLVSLSTPVYAGPNDCPILLLGFLTNDPTLVNAFTAFKSGDCRKALKIFKEFSLRKNANAQNNVGVFYEAGLGVKTSDEVAEHWYRKAAERGQMDAQYNLAAILVADLMRGLKPRDQRTRGELFVEAFKWVSIAASKGHQGAIEGVKRMGKKMTSSQIENANTLARKWKPKRTHYE